MSQKGKRNQHEWGVIAHTWNAQGGLAGEWAYCPLCGKFMDDRTGEIVRESAIPSDATLPDDPNYPYWERR